MIFHSLTFVIFFIATVVLSTALERRMRIYALILASYIFYSANNVDLLLILIVSTFFNYIIAIVIETNRNRKFWLTFGVACNLSVLFF